VPARVCVLIVVVGARILASTHWRTSLTDVLPLLALRILPTSLLQAIFMTPELRKALYNLSPKDLRIDWREYEKEMCSDGATTVAESATSEQAPSPGTASPTATATGSEGSSASESTTPAGEEEGASSPAADSLQVGRASCSLLHHTHTHTHTRTHAHTHSRASARHVCSVFSDCWSGSSPISSLLLSATLWLRRLSIPWQRACERWVCRKRKSSAPFRYPPPVTQSS
jgi:hypothetical protein